MVRSVGCLFVCFGLGFDLGFDTDREIGKEQREGRGSSIRCSII